jgi:hypothetical protein
MPSFHRGEKQGNENVHLEKIDDESWAPHDQTAMKSEMNNLIKSDQIARASAI